jgi:hypothetical protein
VVWFARIFARLVQHRRDVLYYAAKSDPYRSPTPSSATRSQAPDDGLPRGEAGTQKWQGLAQRTPAAGSETLLIIR